MNYPVLQELHFTLLFLSFLPDPGDLCRLYMSLLQCLPAPGLPLPPDPRYLPVPGLPLLPDPRYLPAPGLPLWPHSEADRRRSLPGTGHTPGSIWTPDPLQVLHQRCTAGLSSSGIWQT